MKAGWFRSQKQLDDDQKKFILLPATGRYSLVGPPGSGKTNLLLLRAQFLAGQGEQNVLFITYTNALADFIRAGITDSGLIEPDQIKTYHAWASQHIATHLGERVVEKGAEFDEDVRSNVSVLLAKARLKLQTQNLYSAIFVDEAQDLTPAELTELLALSDNVCICGDARQGIYQREGLQIAAQLGLEQITLKRHYRIGQRIAKVADRLMPPVVGASPLEDTSNYDPKDQGESTAQMFPCATRDEQFAKMLKTITVQLDAFKGENIGVFCGTRATLAEVKQRFLNSELSEQFCAHGSGESGSFTGNVPIHIMTIHGAKGAEFRAVHMYGTEDLKFPLHHRELGYTAITRAKTSLAAYRTGRTNHPLEAAFAQPKNFGLDDLLPKD